MSFRFAQAWVAVPVSVVVLCACGRSVPAQPTAAQTAAPAARGSPLRFTGIAPDAGDDGPYAVSAAIDYEFDAVAATADIDSSGRPTAQFPQKVNVRGVLRLPLGVAPAGGFPVILFQHGRHGTCSTTGTPDGSESFGMDCEAQGLKRIRSDLGYDYIARHLASHGYVVLSMDANDINAQDSGGDAGITARAEVLLHQLDIFRDIARNPASAWRHDRLGNDFSALYGRLDFSRVGLMGHSRGGNGVSKAVAYNRDARFDDAATSFDDPHSIVAVFALAPTDFANELPTNVAWVTLSPYCDGDVTTLHGTYMYDHVRYLAENLSGPHFQITAMGANHNFYNDNWFADDAELFDTADPYCGASSPLSGRFSRADQRRHGEFLIASFLRLYAGGERQFAGYWNALDQPPASACPGGAGSCDERFHLAFHQPPAQRLLIDGTLEAASLQRNEKGPSTYSGFVRSGYCIPNGSTLDDVLAGAPDRQCPSPATISKAPQLFGQWGPLGGNVVYSVGDLDVSAYDFFTLRAGVSVTPENARGQDFTLSFTDTRGATATALASDFSDALYFPPGLTVSALNAGAKTVMNMLPFRLSAEVFVRSGVDFRHLSEIRIAYDRTPAGTVQFTDVMFQRIER